MVEDLAALGGDEHGAGVALVDDLLQRLRLDRLQEPQPGAEAGEQHHGDRREHAEPCCSLVGRHCYSLVTGTARTAAPMAGRHSTSSVDGQPFTVTAP